MVLTPAFLWQVALSVAVFFVAYFGLITGSAGVVAWGGGFVLAATLLFWFAGVWRGIFGALTAFVFYFVVASFTFKGGAKK